MPLTLKICLRCKWQLILVIHATYTKIMLQGMNVIYTLIICEIMYILSLVVCFLPDENDFIRDNIIFLIYHLVNIGKFIFVSLCTALVCDFFIIYIDFFFL